jgi:thiamine-phosphate pyrophosphorylase
MHTSQAQAAARRKLLAASRLAKRARTRSGQPLPRAWFMTDPKRTPHPERIVARLPAGFGVIYRHFGAWDRFETGRALANACRAQGLVLLVSADPDLARAIHANGVHWPLARLRGVRARKSGWVETASAHSARDVARASRLGVDAVILSTVFESGSASAGRPMGVLRFRGIARTAALPVYALGGITPGNAARAMTHAAGWAAIDAVLSGWEN